LLVGPGSDETGAAVVPVSNSDTASTDPWQLLAQGEGIRIDWSPWTGATTGRQWGPTLTATSAFARQLGAVTERAGAGAGAAGKTLFRLELPTGQTVQNLVPAVGGGFRGLLRAPGSPGIVGQARLIPVSGAAVGAGAGAVTLGPLVGIMALSVGVEMLARREQDLKLKATQSTASRSTCSWNSPPSWTPHSRLSSPRTQPSLTRRRSRRAWACLRRSPGCTT